jgi:hypothetical protein
MRKKHPDFSNRTYVTLASAIVAVVFATSTFAEPAQTRLSLDAKWDTRFQGGSATMSDLVRLFGSLIQPKSNLAGDPSIEIYPGITYLMPFKDAVKALRLSGNLPSKNKVGCPGFPKESFFYYTFKGLFLGGFTQMCIVVDRADQVTAIQLVQEAPRPGQFLPESTSDKGWLTYNFVNYRNKAINKLRIEHRILYYGLDSSPSWENWYNSNRPSTPFELIQINTVLFDPEYRTRDGSTEPRTLEAVRWYLPVPLAELILFCINNSMNSRS